MDRKIHSKSIRLSDKVLKYIENSEGEGFNNKFENIIIFAMESEREQNKRLKEIEKTIQRKSDELYQTEEQIKQLKNLEHDLKKIIDEITSIHRSANRYISVFKDN